MVCSCFWRHFLGKSCSTSSKGLQQNPTLFQLCSIPTIIWGLIYGNFFGSEFSFQLLSAQDDVNQILVLSVIFGYIQIMFGLALKFYILWRKKTRNWLRCSSRFVDRLFDQCGFCCAGMLLFPDTPLLTIGIVMIAASLLAVAIGGSLEGKTLAGKIGSGL